MRAAIPLSISAALALLLAAVLTSGKPLPTGTFRGERPIPASPDADPVVVTQLARLQLTVEPGGSAVFQRGGVPFEGRVTRSGDTLNFEVLTVANQNIARQDPSVPRSFTIEIASDGSLRYEGVILKPSP